ncbi:ATP-dependent RNA helicase mss116 [Trichophyton equinum CBS 127.97]|uniref:ATP-dependent RNA helicase n=1 Tax=Trichophyton equinum (strain ATCC MYA-4606 / CBS 127.97) TaxID=559882 RepID=F2PRA1_TRIEC|nr:ATP-dependent RNA helicase mss116 [Trichophyton equinum CBS 127.97]
MSVRFGQLLSRNLQRCAIRLPVASTLAKHSIRRLPIAPLLTSRAFHASPQFRVPAGTANAGVAVEDVGEAELITEFSELGEKGVVDQRLINAITKGMGLKTMTDVQAQTINESIQGIDMIAQAKTGTGKTVAFLLPVIHIILQDPTLGNLRRNFASAQDIRAVVISPTRELAEQIAVEAQKITRGSGLKVQTAVGGTRKREGLMRLQREGCHILVGTPGRLMDLFSDPTSGVAAPKLQAFVLDEADRLLDIGFAPDIERIQSFFPSRSQVDRQTLMFSATIPKSVKGLARSMLKPDFIFVNTVGDETPTHLRVPQRAVFLRGFENQLPALFEIAKRAVQAHAANPDTAMPFKAVVYYGSTAEVSVARRAFTALCRDLESLYTGRAPRIQTIEMHSRLTQAQRTFNSDSFRRATTGILFSSDVTARGMDFPNVSHVIQMGVPNDTDTYIHRLGRTARADKTGEGWILFPDIEFDAFGEKLRSLPIKEDTSIESASVDLTNPAQFSESIASVYDTLSKQFSRIFDDDKLKAYRAMNNQMSKYDKRESRRLLHQLATSIWGYPEPPYLPEPSPSRAGGRYSRSQRGGSGGYGGYSDRRGGSSYGGRGGSRGGSYGSGRDYGRDRGFHRGFDRRGSQGDRRRTSLWE